MAMVKGSRPASPNSILPLEVRLARVSIDVDGRCRQRRARWNDGLPVNRGAGQVAIGCDGEGRRAATDQGDRAAADVFVLNFRPDVRDIQAAVPPPVTADSSGRSIGSSSTVCRASPMCTCSESASICDGSANSYTPSRSSAVAPPAGFRAAPCRGPGCRRESSSRRTGIVDRLAVRHNQRRWQFFERRERVARHRHARARRIATRHSSPPTGTRRQNHGHAPAARGGKGPGRCRGCRNRVAKIALGRFFARPAGSPPRTRHASDAARTRCAPAR